MLMKGTFLHWGGCFDYHYPYKKEYSICRGRGRPIYLRGGIQIWSKSNGKWEKKAIIWHMYTFSHSLLNNMTHLNQGRLSAFCSSVVCRILNLSYCLYHPALPGVFNGVKTCKKPNAVSVFASQSDLSILATEWQCSMHNFLQNCRCW